MQATAVVTRVVGRIIRAESELRRYPAPEDFVPKPEERHVSGACTFTSAPPTLGAELGTLFVLSTFVRKPQPAPHTCLHHLPCFPALPCAPRVCEHVQDPVQIPAPSAHCTPRPPGLSPTLTSQHCWWRSCFRSTWRNRRSHPQVTPFASLSSHCGRASWSLLTPGPAHTSRLGCSGTDHRGRVGAHCVCFSVPQLCHLNHLR